MKTCSKCRRELIESQFVKSSRYLDGLYPSCKECRRQTFLNVLKKTPMCIRCKQTNHMPASMYCSPCLIFMRDHRTRKPAIDWEKKRNMCRRCKTEPREHGQLCHTCRIMCSKCNSRERATSAVWCQVCINESAKPRRVKKKGTWYKSRTPDSKEKLMARKAVNLAVRLGLLKRMPCEVCGRVEVQGHHHEGYSRENQLRVRWLCPEHHKALEQWQKYILTKRGLRV